MAAGTNVGLIRQNNEDNFVVCPDLTTSDWKIPQVSDYKDLGEYGALLVVADGMGGANAGEVASAIAVETIQEAFSQDHLKEIILDDNAVQEFMKEVVKAADSRIFEKSKKDSNTRGMGTTVVMAWILGKRVYVCWCGDSRCYMLNKHKGLVRLSKDHSYVQELIDRGELDPDLAMNHPYSNVITRCLGDMENRAIPDTRIFQLHNGDTILLCSDGLSGLCSDLQILDLLIKHRDNAEDCKNELISAALNEGGHDNVTVALCNIEIPSDKEDEEDEALPQGTLPPVPLSETLKTDEPFRQQKPPKRGFWKGALVFIVMVAIAFLTVKWLRTPPDNQMGEVVPTDTTDTVINPEKEEFHNVITTEITETKEETPEQKTEETIPTQATEVKEDVKDTTPAEPIKTSSVDMIKPDSAVNVQPDSIKQN